MADACSSGEAPNEGRSTTWPSSVGPMETSRPLSAASTIATSSAVTSSARATCSRVGGAPSWAESLRCVWRSELSSLRPLRVEGAPTMRRLAMVKRRISARTHHAA